jgi:hypothetical protein
MTDHVVLIIKGYNDPASMDVEIARTYIEENWKHYERAFPEIEDRADRRAHVESLIRAGTHDAQAQEFPYVALEGTRAELEEILPEVKALYEYSIC